MARGIPAPPNLLGGGGATIDTTTFGYARLARSLVQFCGMRCGEAVAFVQRCAGAPVNFSAWDSASPYLTEVQFYKSMQALFTQIGGEQAVGTEANSHLWALMNDIAEQFWRAHGMEITDSQTSYALCEPTLSPSAEPVVCLLDMAVESPPQMC